jgi:hypothetical protein
VQFIRLGARVTRCLGFSDTQPQRKTTLFAPAQRFEWGARKCDAYRTNSSCVEQTWVPANGTQLPQPALAPCCAARRPADLADHAPPSDASANETHTARPLHRTPRQQRKRCGPTQRTSSMAEKYEFVSASHSCCSGLCTQQARVYRRTSVCPAVVRLCVCVKLRRCCCTRQPRQQLRLCTADASTTQQHAGCSSCPVLRSTGATGQRGGWHHFSRSPQRTRARTRARQRTHPHRTRPCLQIRDIGSGNFGVAKLMRNKATNELVAVKYIERGERVRGGARAGRAAGAWLHAISCWQCRRRRGSTLQWLQPARQQAQLGTPLSRQRGGGGGVTRRGACARARRQTAPRCVRPATRTQVDKNVEREILNHRMLLNTNVVSFKEVCVRACACVRACVWCACTHAAAKAAGTLASVLRPAAARRPKCPSHHHAAAHHAAAPTIVAMPRARTHAHESPAVPDAQPPVHRDGVCGRRGAV